MALAEKAFDQYGSKVEVPEPLFIDLVRGLNSKTGEWEINSLFSHSQGRFQQMNWAPEIEYVIRTGTSIEFEFPMEGGELTHYKVAGQQRLYRNLSGSTVHGLQFIYETNRQFNHSETSIFYIVAHRINYRFSVLGMYGFRNQVENWNGINTLLNQSVFYNYSREVDFGLEINYDAGQLNEDYWQVIPQVHLALNDGYKIQFGFGALASEDQINPVGTFRIIREFNQ